MELFLARLLVGVLVLNLIISITYPIAISLINYIFRKEYNHLALEEWKGKLLNTTEPISNQVGIYVIFMAIWGLSCVVAEEFFDIPHNECPIVAINYIGLFLLSVATLPFLRWLVDVSRNLKIKSETGDSEKIKDLQKQIDDLKNK